MRHCPCPRELSAEGTKTARGENNGETIAKGNKTGQCWKKRISLSFCSAHGVVDGDVTSPEGFRYISVFVILAQL